LVKLTRFGIGFLFLGFALSAPAQTQQYAISTYAGVARQPQGVFFSQGVAADAAGTVYFSRNDYDDVANVQGCFCVFKLDHNGVVTRIAGNSQAGYSGDGGPAVSALLNRPMGLAVDGAGNVFIVDTGNSRIRKISPDGTITTVAGNGTYAGGMSGDAGDGGPATSTPLAPWAVATDPAGNLFIADGSRRVRKVSPDGTITTVAGNGMYGNPGNGDGGPATSAKIGIPTAVALDGAGNLLIANDNRVRKVSPDGIITTVAGVGPPNSLVDDCTAGLGDGAPATQAHLCTVGNVAADRVGNLFINELGYSRGGDAGNVALRKVSPDGIITTVAGDGPQLYGLWQTAVDGKGTLFIAEGGSILKISSEGILTTVAGWGACCYSGDGGPATSAQLNVPSDLGVDSAGNLFIADEYNHRIRRVSPDGNIATVAGGTLSLRCLAPARDSDPATAAQLCRTDNIAVDSAGNVFIADYYLIRKLSPDGTITVVAGNGSNGYSGDGGLATDAQIGIPTGMALDGAGNLFFYDFLHIRKVSPDGIITTVAGNGQYSYTYVNVDGGLAINTPIDVRGDIAVDGAGNLFFADGGTRIRKVSSDGILTTVAGGGKDFPGDGGPATNAQMTPNGVAVDRARNLFISHDGRIGKVSPDGIITTIAGGGTNGALEGGLATGAKLLYPKTPVVDASGNVYFIDLFSVVRILRPINSPL
jgi:hypothetical protein